jgi:hypothetical protein
MLGLMSESIFRLGSRRAVLLWPRKITPSCTTRSASSTAHASKPTAPDVIKPKPSFHKRVLPANLVAMSSPAGKAMFRESLAGVCVLSCVLCSICYTPCTLRI